MALTSKLYYCHTPKLLARERLGEKGIKQEKNIILNKFISFTCKLVSENEICFIKFQNHFVQ